MELGLIILAAILLAPKETLQAILDEPNEEEALWMWAIVEAGETPITLRRRVSWS